jgi:rRNA maturation endonuclease Nob1
MPRLRGGDWERVSLKNGYQGDWNECIACSTVYDIRKNKKCPKCGMNENEGGKGNG